MDYYTQKSRSVDNLDGGPPINSVVPSTDTSDGSNHLNTPPPSHTKGGSMNDLLDSSSGHSGGNSGVSGGGVRNMGGRRSEGRVTVHSTTNASTHLKCTVKGGTVDVLIAYATQDSIDGKNQLYIRLLRRWQIWLQNSVALDLKRNVRLIGSSHTCVVRQDIEITPSLFKSCQWVLVSHH